TSSPPPARPALFPDRPSLALRQPRGAYGAVRCLQTTGLTPRGHTPIHIGGLNHCPRNQSKNLRSPTSLTRRRRKTKELFPKGYKNDADRRACHAAPNLWKTDKVYAGETLADQESR